MGSFPYPFNSVPSDLTQAASWLQSNFQDAADTAYVDAEIAAASLATAAGVQANLDAHIADSTDAHDASAISVVDTGGYYSSTDVEGSLQEAGADTATVASGLAAHLADTTDAHDASAISILDTANDFTATDVEGALAELQSDAEADAADLAAHISDTTDAHDASAISYAGGTGMSASDVEAAIDELATEKANASDLVSTQAEVDAVEVDLAAHEAETSTAHGGFYTQTQSNARFVNIDGDTMTGDLAVVEGSAAVVLSADSIQFGAGTESAGAEWGLDLFGTGIWGGAEVDSLDVGFERLTPGVLSITSGDDLDMRPGVLYVDTQTPADNSEKAASTAYVDDAVSAGGGAAPSDDNPLMNGTAAPGVSALVSRKDHVHPSDTTRLALAGGTMSGAIAMGSSKITGLAAATANGEAVRYEQAILQSLLSSNGQSIFHDGTSVVAAGATARFKVGGFTCPGSTGNYSVTGLGFKPGLVVFETIYSDAAYIFRGSGAMDAAGNQWAMAIASLGGTNAERSISDGCIYLITNAGANSARAAFVSMDTGGFTVNFGTVDATTIVKWIAYR